MAAPTINAVGNPAINTAATTHPVEYPPAGTISAGDLLIVHFRIASASATLTDQQGFTFPSELVYTTTGIGTSMIGWKYATGSEDGTTANFVGPSSASAGIIACIRGTKDTNPFDVYFQEPVSTTTTTFFDIDPVTTLGSDRLLLWMTDSNSIPNVNWSGASTTDPEDLNELWDFQGGTNRSLAGTYLTQASAGISTAMSVNYSANGLQAGRVLVIAPPVATQVVTLRPDAILEQVNDTKTLTELQRDV